MDNSWIILLPAIITISLAIITRRVNFSLLSGIVLAALFASDFSLIKAPKIALIRLWETSELGSLSSWGSFWSNFGLFIFMFLFILGIIITLINHTGAASAYSNFVRKRIKSKRSAETSSLLLSSCLFIDDYLNSFTTGIVMRPIVDQFSIPRVKLAFLIDAMAASLCAISPISSWFAAIIAPIRKTGITNDTFWLFLSSIPFIFYAFIIILSTWFIVLRRISFGSMHKYENNMQEAPIPTETITTNNSIIDFILPVATLFIFVLTGLLYTGGFYLLGGQNSFTKALQSSEISIALFVSSAATLIIYALYSIVRRQLKISSIPNIFISGIKLMLPSVMILFLAWTFGSIIRTDLNTGQYLASLLVGSISIKFIPLMFFAASLMISLATGSAWGTIAIMIPIAIPMLLSLLNATTAVAATNIPILFPLIGSIISGAIAGDHISPISDTTIMSSTSAGTSHIDHVRTQIPYAFPAIFSTALAFLLSGFLMQYGYVLSLCVSMAAGIVTSFCILGAANYLNRVFRLGRAAALKRG